MRPRTYPIYIKEFSNFSESLLARQTNSNFIQKVNDEYKSIIENPNYQKSKNSFNYDKSISNNEFPNFKPPIYTGNKKKYFTEGIQSKIIKDLEESKSSGAFSAFKKTSFYKNFFKNNNEDKKKPSILNNRDFNDGSNPIPNIGENIFISNKGFVTSGILGEKNINNVNTLQNPFVLNTNFNIHKYTIIDKKVDENIMSIPNFLSQYITKEDLENLELSHMTDIDYVKLDELKQKSIEFIDATSHISTGEEDNSSDDFAIFFNEKLAELKENDINIQIFIQNLDKVSGILYEKNGCKIFFKS